MQVIASAYGAIIYKGDFHHRLEFAILHSIFLIALPHFLYKIVIQSAGILWVCRAMKVWFCSLFRSCQKSELRYCKVISRRFRRQKCLREKERTTEHLAVNVSYTALPLQVHCQSGIQLKNINHLPAPQTHHPITSFVKPYLPGSPSPSRCLPEPQRRRPELLYQLTK